MPIARKPATRAAIRSLSFTRSSPAPRTSTWPPCTASAAIAGSSSIRPGTRRRLSDQAGPLRRRDIDGAGAIALDDDRAARLAGVARGLGHGDACTEAAEHVEQAGARRVQADVFDFDA